MIESQNGSFVVKSAVEVSTKKLIDKVVDWIIEKYKLKGMFQKDDSEDVSMLLKMLEHDNSYTELFEFLRKQVIFCHCSQNISVFII